MRVAYYKSHLKCVVGFGYHNNYFYMLSLQKCAPLYP